MSDLVSCPHCEGQAEHRVDCDPNEPFIVRCTSCGSNVKAGTREDAASKWNRRAYGWISVNELKSIPAEYVLATDGSDILYGELYQHQSEIMCMQSNGRSVMRHIVAFKHLKLPKQRPPFEIGIVDLKKPKKGDFVIELDKAGKPFKFTQYF